MRVRRAVEVACFAPLGACATVVAAVRRRRRRPATAATRSGTPAAAPAPGVVPVTTETPVTSASSADAPTGASAELPIDGYDHLAASQVVDRLGALNAAELAAVAAYERAHRHRQTVLARVAQLQA